MSNTVDPSTAKLLADLRALPPSQPRDALIERAKRNEFHDYKSESATPCIDLVGALRAAGFTELAEKAMDGAYDGTAEEARAWVRRGAP